MGGFNPDISCPFRDLVMRPQTSEFWGCLAGNSAESVSQDRVRFEFGHPLTKKGSELSPGIVPARGHTMDSGPAVAGPLLLHATLGLRFRIEVTRFAAGGGDGKAAGRVQSKASVVPNRRSPRLVSRRKDANYAG